MQVSSLGTTDTVALTVHGQWGEVDLVVPLGATVADVSREYAAQAGLAQAPPLVTSTGRSLDSASPLSRSGVASGDLLVAVLGGPSGAVPAKAPAPPRDDATSPAAGVWFAVAALMGVAAGVLVATRSGLVHDTVVGLLALAAALGVLPVGRYADQRSAAAPAFAAAGAYALAWQPGDASQALSFGVAALAAAVVAGVARALGAGRSEVHDVWISAGVAVFAVTGGVVLAGMEAQVAWALLVTLAVLASRFVPGLAVDVPDQMLIDIEKLAVTAWSARDRLVGRRGRTVVHEAGIAEVMRRGWRIVDASAVGILVVVVVALPSLQAAAHRDLDVHGVNALTFFTGATLLLVARSYRHAVAAWMLRIAGLYAWAVLAVVMLGDSSDARLMLVVVLALVLAACVVAAALATGRGWRSVWWATKAELAELLCGSGVVAGFVMAAGIFRHMWEFTS